MVNETPNTVTVGVDAIFQYTSSGAQLISGMLFYVIVSRLFSPLDVGAIALFVTITVLLSLVFSFGLNVAAQHFTSYNSGISDYLAVKNIAIKFLFFGLLLSFASLIFLNAISKEISLIFFHSISYTYLIRLLSIALLGNVLFSICNGILLGLQNFRLTAIVNIFVWIIYYLGALIFTFYIRSLSSIIFGWIFGILIGVVIEIAIISKSLPNKSIKGKVVPTKTIFYYSLPVLFAGIVSYGAASADRFIVSCLLNLANLGVYNFALLISSSVSFISIPFNNILMPKFSEMYGSKNLSGIKVTSSASITLLTFLYVPIALIVSALSPIILQFLAGETFLRVSLPLSIMMFLTSAFSSSNIITQVISAIRKTRVLFYASATALLSNVALSLVLIPRFGIIGAAIGFSSVYVITFLLLYTLAKKEDVISFDYYSIIKIWISALSMFAFLFGLSHFIGLEIYFLPLYVIVGVALYVIVSKALITFNEEKKAMVLSLFPVKWSHVRKLMELVIS